MRRQHDRQAGADEIARGAEGVDFAGRDVLKGLAVVRVAEEDLLPLARGGQNYYMKKKKIVTYNGVNASSDGSGDLADAEMNDLGALAVRRDQYCPLREKARMYRLTYIRRARSEY